MLDRVQLKLKVSGETGEYERRIDLLTYVEQSLAKAQGEW